MFASSKPRVGLKDAKRLSRALQQALAQSRPITLDQCKVIVENLPIAAPSPAPSAAASSPQLIDERVAMLFHPKPRPEIQPTADQAVSGTTTRPDLVIEGDPPTGALELGQVVSDTSILAGLKRRLPPSLSWTPEGMLRHGLMFGCCGSGQTETVLGLAVNAMDQGLGITLINAHGDTSLPVRMLKHAASRSPSALERVRVITMMSGDGQTPPTHTFNPFAQGSASQHVELLLDALSVPHALDALPVSHQELLIPLLSALLLPLVWGRDRQLWPLDLSQIAQHLRLPRLLALRDVPGMPPQVRTALDYVFNKLAAVCPGQSQAEAYAPFEQVLAQDLLDPIVSTYAHVLNAPTQNNSWRHPDVVAKSMIEQHLITVVNLRALEKCPLPDWVAARLITSALSAEVVAQAQRAPIPFTAPRHLVIAQHAPLHLSGRAASQLLRFGAAAGVSCLITANDYPQLKTIPELAETVGLCHTKFFMKPCHEQAHAHAAQLVGPLAPSSKTLATLSEGLPMSLQDQHCGKTTLAFHPTYPGPTPSLPQVNGQWQRLGGSTFIPGQVDRNRMARVLLERISSAPSKVALSWCQETVARMLGYAHWHELNA